MSDTFNSPGTYETGHFFRAKTQETYYDCLEGLEVLKDGLPID